jgi:hypothetical protein
VHHQGWEHFSESQQTLLDAFTAAGMAEWIEPLFAGVPAVFNA